MTVSGRRTPVSHERDPLHLPGFVVRTRRQAAAMIIPPHAHDTANLGLCVQGAFAETVGCRSVTMTPATLIGRPAGEVHENRFATPARYITIEFSPRGAASRHHAAAILDRSFVRESAFIAATTCRIDRELRERDAVTPLVIESLVHELVAHAERSGDRRLQRRMRCAWLDEAIALLRDAPCGTTTLGLGELAAHVGIHPSHFARTFRREVGCSVGEYVRASRLDEASRLLRASRLRLAEIALATGFSDQSHFSTAFRRRFCVTPGEFRRMARTW